MFVLPGLIGNTQRNCFDKTAAAGGPFAVSYLTNLIDTVDATTYTFSTVSLGDADAGRKILVPLYTLKADPAATISSVTIGGVSAALVTGTNTTVATGGASHLTEMWEAAVPTGTTGDIVITCSAQTVRMAGGVYRIVSGTSSSGGATSGTSVQTLNTGSSLVIPTDGVGICYSFASASSNYGNWTNVDDVLGDFDAVVETTRVHAGAQRATAGSTQVTATAGSAGNVMTLNWVAYGP